jgi:hypothetical protein
MKRFCQPLLLPAVFLLSSSLLTAQEAWRAIAMESPSDHHPMPFLKAIGIPATATYKGERHKAFVFVWGREKETGTGFPSIEVYIDGLSEFITEKELEQFEGPDLSIAATKATTFVVSITKGKHVLQAVNRVELCGGAYPESLVPQDGNNLFDTGINQDSAQRAVWKQFMREMSLGFDVGHISIGGKVISPNIEIDFSGNGIGSLLQDLIRVVGP